jgi:uncharacterized protein
VASEGSVRPLRYCDTAEGLTLSADPDDPRFSFSFARRAFYVIGLHPRSSRWARRFAWPTLIFNAHDQFEDLHAHGQFGRLKEAINRRDSALQGRPNPRLTEFGTASEAPQYAAREVDSS